MHTKMLIAVLIATAGTALADNAKPNAPNCDRKCLGNALDSYFEALTKRDPSKLAVAGNLKFTENGSVLKLGEGFWQTAGKTTFRLDAIDPVSGQAAAEAVVEENGKKPTMVLVRLKLDNKKISEAETIVMREGDHNFYGPTNLAGTTATAYQESIPIAERGTREQLIAAANAYFIALETRGTPQYQRAPFLPDTKRVENGVQSTNVALNGNPPKSAIEEFDNAPAGGVKLTVENRRYPVVDEEHGIVLTIGEMHVSARPGKIQLLAEFFKLTNGKIKEIQAIVRRDPPSNSAGW